MNKIKANIQKIKAQINQACHGSSHQHSHSHKQENNPSSNNKQNTITLLAVSKTKPISAIEQAYLAGQRDFGENYLQEAIEKITKLSNLPDICWHFIGPIQSNKTKQIAQHFNWVHSVDRAKIAQRLNDHLNAVLFWLIDKVFSLAEVVDNCDKLTLRGLMAIPEKNAGEASYEKMQYLFKKLQAQYPTVDTLSMGMSNDLALAIAYGSTMVRIGTAIFGERS